MSAAVAGWIAFAFAVAVAGVLFARLRSAEAARAAAAGELTAQSAELESTQKRLEQRGAELRARGEELSELRKKHDKLKRRAGDEREEEKGAPARIRALEADLAAERADSRAARDEIVRLLAETERAGAELARVGSELEAAKQRLAEVTPLADPGQLDALRARAQAGEERATKLTGELQTALQNSAKYKGRWETLDKTYIVLRGELELKKDELRNLRAEVERLRALEVVLVEPETRPPEPPA
jgi:predicted  nucleic acid-binding Zn-ribbon protein